MLISQPHLSHWSRLRCDGAMIYQEPFPRRILQLHLTTPLYHSWLSLPCPSNEFSKQRGPSQIGHNRATTLPVIRAIGSGPKSRESRDAGRLSPTIQQWPFGTCLTCVSYLGSCPSGADVLLEMLSLSVRTDLLEMLSQTHRRASLEGVIDDKPITAAPRR